MRTSEKFRLPNKTQWALNDLECKQIEARRIMDDMLAWLEHQRTEAGLNMDKARMANLGKLSHHIAQLSQSLAKAERLVSDAQRGIYRQGLDGE